MTVLAILLIALVSLLMFTLIASFITTYIEEILPVERSKTKIPFSHFKKMYYINPDKWRLMYDKVCYNNTNILYFSFLDTVRYRGFKDKLDKDEAEEIKNEQTVTLYQEFQKDIDKYRDENREYIEEKLKELAKEVRSNYDVEDILKKNLKN